MNLHDMKSVVTRFIEEVANGRRVEIVDQFLAGDFRLPPGADGLDRDGLVAVLKYYFTAFPDLHYTIEDIVAEGDTVVTRLRMQGTQDGEYMGRPASGRRVDVEEVDIFKVVDGRIANYRIVWDEIGLHRQLGLLE